MRFPAIVHKNADHLLRVRKQVINHVLRLRRDGPTFFDNKLDIPLQLMRDEETTWQYVSGLFSFYSATGYNNFCKYIQYFSLGNVTNLQSSSIKILFLRPTCDIFRLENFN